MNRPLIQIIVLVLALYLTSSCEKIFMQPEQADTPMNNFQMLWETFDRKYSFFTYKKIDWDSIYNIYHPSIHEDLHDTSLFRIFEEMLLSLEDIHTDLWSPQGIIKYSTKDLYPENFSMLIRYYTSMTA